MDIFLLMLEFSLKSKTAHSLFFPLDFFWVLVSVLVFDYWRFMLEVILLNWNMPSCDFSLSGSNHNSFIFCLTYASIIKSKIIETLVHSERSFLPALHARSSEIMIAPVGGCVFSATL